MRIIIIRIIIRRMNLYSANSEQCSNALHIKSSSGKLDAITNTTLKNKTKQEQKLVILILNTNTTATKVS